MAVWMMAACLGIIFTGRAQSPIVVTSAELYLRLKKLNVLGTVLYVAAHPDDENSRLIAYMAKERLYRTGYLSMTRGDGGQNLIGDEQGFDLGLIRTQEMLAARRMDGAEQFFSRAFDFGFSKSTDEALHTWNKEKILSDAVWVIRKFQPDVIITRFPEDSRAGHGHHSASAVLAHEAFAAAADPNRFPEQFKYGVKPWQAKRILWNTFNFGGGANTTSDDQLKIDVGVYNPILGKSYGEIAAESRTNHKSQGAALTPTRGQMMEYFTLVAGDPAVKDPMDGVATGWSRIDGGQAIEGMVDRLIKDFSMAHPEKSVAGLVEVYKAISRLKDGYWKTQKLKEVQQLIGDCSGLWLEAVTGAPYVVQGKALPVTFVLNNRLNTDIAVKEITLDKFDTVYNQSLTEDRNYSFTKEIAGSPGKPVTQPYWLAEPMSPGSFNVSDQQLIGNPQSAPAYEARFRLVVDGQELTYTRPVLYKFTDPVKGEEYEPVTVVPAWTARTDPGLLVFADTEEKKFNVILKDNAGGGTAPMVSLSAAPGLTIGAEAQWSDTGAVSFRAKPSIGGPVVRSGYLMSGSKDTLLELRTIAYDHIPRIDYFRPATEKFVLADVKTAGHRIGYIEGAGDKVPQALIQMGYEVMLLKEKDITPGYLAQFDAIIAGIRAYEVHPWLEEKHAVLMGYVKAGGNLIAQYNRENLGKVTTTIGPYPFSVNNLRVTDETAKVNFLLPEHPVLNYPNKITDKDFDGWIQERGIYFAGQMDPAYQAVFSMRDPNENQDLTGSLVIAHYGKGDFVYTGLVFFRELPAGVPGAYRLMANIIALNQKKAF